MFAWFERLTDPFAEDNLAVPPQGLPYTVSLTVAANGRAAQGTVANAMGMSTQIVMQAK